MHKHIIYSRSAKAFNVLFNKNLSEEEVKYLDTLLSMLKDVEEIPQTNDAVCETKATPETLSPVLLSEKEAIREAMEELIKKLNVLNSSPVNLFLGSRVITDSNDITVVLCHSIEFF